MNVCQKIDAFERHVLDRQLRIAQILGHHFRDNVDGDPLSQSAFAIISIGFSYFEMIEQFASGKSSNHNSKDFFKFGFARVFPNSPVSSDDVARLYLMLRCGMYHTAMPTDRCGLTRELPSAIANENGVIVINPALLIDELISHFCQFCSDLRDGFHCNLQRNFETMFDSLPATAQTMAFVTAKGTPAPWDQ
jgi:hypothetical protein